MALGTLILPFDTGAYASPTTAILNGITDGSVDSNFGMVQGDQLPVLLVIDIIASGGAPQRYLASIIVYNQVYSGSEGTPAPGTPTFLTEAQSEFAFINNWSQVSMLSGGTSSALDGQPTAGVLTAGTIVAITGIAGLNNGGLSLWQLQAGNNVTGGGYVRPTDYNAGSNAVNWVQLL